MSALDKTLSVWGDGAPDWVVALAEACDASSMGKVGERIGYTKATICQVLNGKRRPGSLNAVERAVREGLMRVTVECPELGDISLETCREHASRPYAGTNPLRVRMYRACQRCVNKGDGNA